MSKQSRRGTWSYRARVIHVEAKEQAKPKRHVELPRSRYPRRSQGAGKAEEACGATARPVLPAEPTRKQSRRGKGSERGRAIDAETMQQLMTYGDEEPA